MISKSIILITKDQEDDIYSSLKNEETNLSFVPIALPITLANKAFQRKSADIILIDCGLDGERGVGWVTEFKRTRSDIPVIFITSLKSHDLVMRAYKLGVRDYYTKPVSVSELNRIIKELLSLKRMSKEKRDSPPCLHANNDCKMTNTMTSDIPTKIACIVHYIEENIARSLNLSDLAKQANLSKYHFARLFKNFTGFSPVEFAFIYKMHKAKKLLVDKDFSISTVAGEVGYLDLRNFDRRFKDYTGYTPSAYRMAFSGK